MVLYKEITKEKYVCERASQNNEQQQKHQRTYIDSGMMVAGNGSTTVNGNIISGHMITLNIHVPHNNIIQPMQFDVQMLVGDICRSIQGHLPITIGHDQSEFGLFVNDIQHSSRSYWLDPSRTLSYYSLKTGDNVEYTNKYRPLKIRLLDGTIRTILVDDSLIVAQLMVYICTKFGIANYDEYSLVYDLDSDDGSSTKTATLRRERSLQRTDKKMEELRKKCHTDDDTVWLDHSKTLRQQEIDEQSTVVLRRKYFFSDTNIDQRDPVQLNLLYIQCRNGILDGTHPVTYDEAVQFAGLQCQIQFGDYQESKHKPNILDVREFLPKEYAKTKGVEKRIFQEHKKYHGLSDLDAKLKYTQLCRSLRTYGVTFFLVKEKMSGKNKLVPRLLGVTKESIVRVDERTKDFLEVWPLTHVKRWTASPNTFTLDFGDYATAYYSVQTHEGQQISQLIAGYIDIILKKRKDREFAIRDGIADEEATMIEDIIAPGKATIIQPNCPSFGYVHQQNVYSPPLIRGTYSDVPFHSPYQHYGLEYYPGQSYPIYSDHEQDDYFTSQIHEQPPLSSILQGGTSGTVLYSSIENARNTVNSAQSQLARDLQMEYVQPPLSSLIDNQQEYSIENRLDVSHQLLTSILSAINASTAQIVILTSDLNNTNNQQLNRRNSDYNHSLGAAISTITNNLNEFCKEMDVYTNLINDKTNLMEQTNRLCSIFNDLLTHIETLSDNNSDSSIRQNILLTASRLGEISQDLARRLANEITMNYFDSSIEYQEKLLTLAKSVANTTALYVLKAKDIATNVQEQNIVNNIISTATQCALATSQLVACTKVVAATISSPLCQEQLIESARCVTRSIEGVLQSCTPSLINDDLYSKLNESGTIVRKSLNELLLHIKLVTDSTAANFDSLCPSTIIGTKNFETDKQTSQKTTTTTTLTRRIIANDEIEEEDEEDDEEILNVVKNHDQSIDQILTTSDRLFSSVGDAVEMVKQAKILAQATAQLVSSLRQQAELAGDDTNQQKKLLSAAKMLADATAKMVESAKGCATKPNDTQLQYQLKKAAEELRSATNIATSNSIKRKVLKRVEQCAKHCASCATQCIAATSGAAMTNKNQQSHQQLVEQCKIVADLIPKVVQGIRGCMVKPDSFSSQANLLYACEDFLTPATRLASLAKASVPTVHDQSQALHLNNSSKQLTQALIDLRACLTRAQELCGSMPLDIESIVESIEMLEKELEELKRQAKDGHLRAKPDETIDTSSTQLTTVCKQVNTIISQLLSAVTQSDEKTVETCTREILQILRKLTNSTRGIAATSNDYEIQETIIERSHEVLQRSTHLVREAKKAINTPNDLEIQNKLAELAREVSSALNACISCMPSQRYFDEAIKQMSEYIYTLAGPFDKNKYTTTINYEIKQNEITNTAANLNQATNDLIISTRNGSIQDLGKTSTRFTRAFGDFINNGIELINHQQDDDKRTHLITSLKNVHTSSNQLLEKAKVISIEPIITNEINQQLSNAGRIVTDNINDVITICLTSKTTSETSIDRIECDNAIREMETSKTYLQQSVLQPCNNYTYYETLDHVIDNSKRLGEAMTHIASASKNTNHQLFTQAVQDASKAVCSLAESSAQASYLVGISEATSTKGTSAIVDQPLFTRSITIIRHSCADLSNSNVDRKEVLSLATKIAKNTSMLCNAARDASSNTTNPIARRRFVESAKDIANGTAELVRTIKILDSSYTTENHRQCIETSRPLLQSIDELYTYAMSKEFAAIPASISVTGRQLQEPILSASRNVVDGACRIVECSKNLIVNSKEPSQWQQLATHTKSVSESIKRLATSVKEMAPGQRECERAIQELRTLFQEVDKSITNIESLRKTDKSLQFHQEQISSSSHFITELILDIRQSSKREAERIGSYVTQFVTYIEPFVQHTIDYVSCMIHVREKLLILEQVKSIIETSLQLIMGTKESGGNIKNLQWHKIVDDNSDLLTKSIHKLVHTLEDQSSSIGIMSGLSENIRKLISTLDTTMLTNQGHFADYQTCMVEILRQMARTIQEILTQMNHTDNIRHLANQLTREYNELINATYGAIGTAITNDLATRIKSVVTDLGLACIELIEKLGLYQQNNHDQNLKYNVENLCQKVIEKISYVLAALQASARGTQACINAASTVSGIIADLDTTILFATAGTLNSEHDGETFADHREAILKTAKALVEDTKTLVAGAASSQEQLASAAQAAVRTITKLAEVVKLGAASLGADDGEAQVMLINSVKDVALALNNLINVTKSASGKNIDDPEMQKLKESAKVMVTNVTSLLRTVKSVEDEAQRGTNALEATIESIAQELRIFNNGQIPTTHTTPEELIRVTKQITLATAKAVAAGQSCRQDDIIAAANLGRKTVSDFLLICKSSAYINDDKTLQQRTLDSGRLCIKYYKELLETIHILIQKSSNETKQKLLNYSRMIAQSTQELVQCAKQLKGADLIDPDDPTYIAENELFNAAQSIEAAAKKLSILKPRRKPKEINENLNFDEQILEAAKSIMNAASALINAATSAQKELALQGKLSTKSTSEEDGQWSQGLISAARYVASACHVLCDAANGLVQGYGTEEKLISSAKQVSSNTAALLVACKVKADFMSQSMARLQTAGNAVKRAADALVRSAQHAVEMQQEDKYFEVSMRVVPGIAQEIKCKEVILTKERELDEARNRLKAIRLAKYGHSEQDSNEST
ncbi:unnamed protein product [Rotaria sordida]|uniref:Talin n=1 Tax=Rotaria sordida TaxID=392033 RepID=A0A813WQ61_9BILA|nr:unnamed protein product [Rotaria sordida]CAF0904471.1 unnamed protein product [Rotaria sordida]